MVKIPEEFIKRSGDMGIGAKGEAPTRPAAAAAAGAAAAACATTVWRARQNHVDEKATRRVTSGEMLPISRAYADKWSL